MNGLNSPNLQRPLLLFPARARSSYTFGVAPLADGRGIAAASHSFFLSILHLDLLLRLGLTKHMDQLIMDPLGYHWAMALKQGGIQGEALALKLEDLLLGQQMELGKMVALYLFS